jgi:RNA polymerase sigma factor (sigma-70 family)
MMDSAPVQALLIMTERSPYRPDLMQRVLAEARAAARSAASDGRLLDRFIHEGDQGAFGTLLDRHGPMLLGLCRRQLHGGNLAEDVLQATFLVLARKANTICRRDNLAGWLYGVARRLIRNAHRTDAARRQRERAAARAESCSEPGWDELLGVLDEELQSLPARYREPLLLCYLEGLTQDEAAARTGWSLSTLRRRLEHGRDLLRARMVRRGATLGGGLIASVVAPSAVRAVVTVELRQSVLAVAGSVLRPTTIAPAVLMLANGELRMAMLTKCLLGSALAVGVGVLTASVWSSGEPVRPALPPPASERPIVAPAGAAGVQLEAPAPGRDLWGDPLPRGALARLGTVQLQHGQYGTGLQFTHGGTQLISLGGGWIRVWDLATGHTRVECGKDWPIAFEMATADGKLGFSCRFVDGQGGGVDLACTEYDLETGKARREFSLELDGPTSRAVLPHAISPDGSLLAGLYQEVRLWRTTDGTLAHRFPLDEGRFWALSFAPDGKTVIAGDDVHTIHVFDLKTGKEQRTFGIPNVDGVAAMAITPDGKRLATRGGGDSFVRLWDVDKGTIERTVDFPEDGAARLLKFTPDGRTLIAGIEDQHTPGRRTIRTWDAATGQAGRAWTADPSIGGVFTVSGEGKLLATMNGAGVIRLWDMETGQERGRQAVSPSGLVAVGWAADGKSLYTLGDDLQLRHWDPVGRELRAPRPLLHRRPVTFAQNGQLVVTDRNERGLDMVRLEDMASGKPLLEVRGQEGVLSPDGKCLATSGAELVTAIHDVASGERVRSLETNRETDTTQHLRPKVRGFTADGRSLIVQGDIVSVWDVETGKQRSSWSLYRNKVLDPQDRLDQPGRFNQPGGGKPGFKGFGGGGKPGFKGFGGGGKAWFNAQGFGGWRGSEREVQAEALSPAGDRIAFAVDWLRTPGVVGGGNARGCRLMVLETLTGKLLQDSPLEDDQTLISRLAFSRDGKLLAAGGLGQVRVWKVGDANDSWRFDGHRGRVDALAFSPDGRRLASASSDSTVLVWELTR